MGYLDTKHTVITAAAATGEAKWQALRAFFNGGGSERWQLANPAAAGTAGMVLTQIYPWADEYAIVIRRVTGGATWYIGADPDGVLALQPGSTTTPMTAAGATEAVLEVEHTPSTAYTKMLVIEHDDAITILEYGNASENAMPAGVHAGCIYVCADPTWATNRSRGCGVLAGAVALGGAGTFATQWLSSGSTGPKSRVFVLNEAWQPYSTSNTDSASQSTDVVLSTGPAAVACPVGLGVSNDSLSRFLGGGMVLKWARFVSADATGGSVPGTRYEIGDDAWVRIGSTATSNARLCMSCQKGKATR